MLKIHFSRGISFKYFISSTDGLLRDAFREKTRSILNVNQVFLRDSSSQSSISYSDTESEVHVSVVQGGSRGIGLEFVRQLLVKQDAGGVRGNGQVVATCRDPSPQGAPLLHDLLRDHPTRLTLLPLDVTHPDSIQAAAAEVGAKLGRVDLLLNVTGLLHMKDKSMLPETSMQKVRAENLMKSYQVNAMGPLLVMQAFQGLLQSTAAKTKNERWPVMVGNVSARVSSIEDNQIGGWYSYRASKTALNQLTKTASVEFGRKHHPVTCILLHPGTVKTELSQPFQKSVPEGKLFTTEKSVSELLKVIEKTSVKDSGSFFAWDGQPIPW
mmetsp:Transcript_18617/g.25813  ORF Transcript_18617/g.25813 Transcript_18617/m.25813 type:complete len:326 (-) Transcript_18617:223-1200(-)|eukprot:CAMPEP_0196581088 /NCGR_PEP_ID=MMETSP1081-20130531/32338_1 /TAXON_ID=36882 /ORGANISM="Pyramimonas amylifera, Strain CCMP720" /LENGTH=325 /DNA_ID=CAMNT_0041901185 /DNA_START=62 /DNA_END=1039 /DNA_ORIENTATION=+